MECKSISRMSMVTLVIIIACALMAAVVNTQAKNAPDDVQKALIALDKEWGEAGGDAAKLDKIIGDGALAIGPKGEAQDKQQLIASNKAASTDVRNVTYTADEYKFDMPSSDVVVMTHRGITKGMQNGKEVTESHRSLHVFQKQNGR